MVTFLMISNRIFFRKIYLSSAKLTMKEENAYILGTDKAELNRLGIQHQIWATEAQRGWKTAGFTEGDTLLDLGSGPGFCTRELAYIAGEKGNVIGIDKSENYINFIDNIADTHGLSITGLAQDFDHLNLPDNSLDGMYCRWALAWVPNPKEVLKKVYNALKPGGKMVIHEYYDWSTHQTVPSKPGLAKAIAACLKSFKDQPGDIDVGQELPAMLTDLGMRVTHTKPMAKLARPKELTWQWPKSFYQIYFAKLAEMGYLKNEDVKAALQDLTELEQTPGATLLCPMLIEVIAEKV